MSCPAETSGWCGARCGLVIPSRGRSGVHTPQVSLLARLANRLPSLDRELAATEALGVLLEDPAGAAALTAAVSVGCTDLPPDIRYSTQAADADGRPDVVGRDGVREVVHVEGKFWAGLTEAQWDGAYKRRLQRQHVEAAPDHPHSGVLLFVCPPRRLAGLWNELEEQYKLGELTNTGSWRFGKAIDAFVVGATSWQALLDKIEGTAAGQLAEDVRQLRALVDRVDSDAFVPWTGEQVTDQESIRRILQLATLVDNLWGDALKKQVATPYKGRQTTSKIGIMTYGKLFELGGLVTTLKVSPWLWAEYGRSPLWLTFIGGAHAARRAFPEDAVEIHRGCAIPVPFRPGALEHQLVSKTTFWLADVAARLEEAVRAGAALSPELPDDEQGLVDAPE